MTDLHLDEEETQRLQTMLESSVQSSRQWLSICGGKEYYKERRQGVEVKLVLTEAILDKLEEAKQ